jgi:hypothetical protein
MEYNPKRLITFKTRLISFFENELINANLNNELDYIEWLNHQIIKVKNDKLRRIKKLNNYE